MMRILSLHIQTGDLEGTRTFYHEIIGLPIKEQSKERIAFQLGYSELVFHFVPGTKPVYHIAFNIPANQVKDALDWLQNKAAVIPVDGSTIIADFINWNAEAIYFYDNNNNILELIARRDLKNPSEKNFGPGSLLSVSEVGVVTTDVNETCLQLMEKFQLDYFSRQPPHKNFSAVGDDEGLFIVVGNYRDWYPTRIRSSIHWCKTEFENLGKRFIYENQ